LFLALGKVGPAEGVFPAQAVPVIYMEAKDIYAGGVGFWEGCYEVVGRGATGAAFGSEELDDGIAVIGGGEAAGRGAVADGGGGEGENQQ